MVNIYVLSIQMHDTMSGDDVHLHTIHNNNIFLHFYGIYIGHRSVSTSLTGLVQTMSDDNLLIPESFLSLQNIVGEGIQKMLHTLCRYIENK